VMSPSPQPLTQEIQISRNSPKFSTPPFRTSTSTTRHSDTLRSLPHR
jgi:hypothetical protein